jgi:hypothetical protein
MFNCKENNVMYVNVMVSYVSVEMEEAVDRTI